MSASAAAGGEGAVRRRAWVALAAAPGLTPRGCAALLAHYGTPEAVLAAPVNALASAPGVSAQAAASLVSAESGRLAGRLLRESERLGVSVLTPDDAAYPARLRELPDPPPALWCRGALDAPAAAIAVVGSRRPSPYGRSMAERFGRELAQAGVTVVSGLARGIDGAVHRAVLDVGGETIAVLGCGVDRVYPSEHRPLQEAIGRDGLLLSEFPPGAPPLAHHFPRRNRLISGLALGVVVVEAGERSGSLITARLALEQGREVFAVPGNLGTGGSIGTNRLIKAGATLVERVEDILQAVAAQIDPSSLRPPRPVPSSAQTSDIDTASLTTEEHALVGHVTGEPRHMDELAARTGRPVQQVAALLVSLEIKGAVRQLPGQFYCRSTV
ncbi:MAG: DNA-protecting protein DprA [Nitrospirae bacterium]|nr:DNA-protecting protein DprA [Nitrospirota bacterium]